MMLAAELTLAGVDVAIVERSETAQRPGSRAGGLHLLLNATRGQILSALSLYRRELPENFSPLIYYAGHGHRDATVDRAYW